MLQLEVRPARVEDARASYRYGDPALVARAIARSVESWTVLLDGEVAAIYGITVGSLLLPPVIWGVTSEASSRHPVALFKAARRVIEAAISKYGAVSGHVVKGCPERWLEMLGFSLAEPAQDGGQIVRRFERWA